MCVNLQESDDVAIGMLHHSSNERLVADNSTKFRSCYCLTVYVVEQEVYCLLTCLCRDVP